MTHTHTRLRQSALATVLAAVVLVGSGGGAFASSTAEPPDQESETVEVASGSQRFGWQTPKVHSAHASIASTSSPDDIASIVTIKDAKAAVEYGFKLNIPAGGRLVATPDGGYDLLFTVHGTDFITGRVAAPWARDANGKTLSTSFSLVGTTLNQHVDVAGAAFPVTADPHYTWGYVTGTVYLNKQETNQLVFGASIFAIVGAVGFGGWGGAPPGGVAAYASYVFNQGHCVKVKFVPYGILYLWYIGEYSGSQGDGYCR